MSDEASTPERLADLRAETEAASGRPAAKRVLGGALRELLEALPWADLPEDDAHRIAEQIRAAAGVAAAAQIDRSGGSSESDLFAGMANFMDRSPIVGLSNPLAPPFEIRIDQETGLVQALGTFGAAYEGGPGVVHGGFLAAVVDEVLGTATILSGRPGLTGELTVRYLGPTPTHTPLEVNGRLDDQSGRRLTVSAEILADGERTVTAQGLFVAVDDAHFAKLDRARRERS